MVFYVSSNDRVGFREMHPLFAELLKDLGTPLGLEHASLRGDSRLFPEPTTDPDEIEFAHDWNAYVQPGLLEHFQSSRSVVETDLKHLHGDETAFQLEFPLAHADAWLNTLNQARLSLAAEHDFTEGELSVEEIPPVEDDRSLALAKVHFYAFIQQCLVDELPFKD